jgi:hypothetical protein
MRNEETVNASSQTPPRGLPPELQPVQPPMPEALRAAYAAYDVAIPAPAGSPAMAPAAPEAPPAPVTTLQAAAAVISAEMKKDDGSSDAQQLAAAEQRAGILFDAAHVEAVRTAAREQAHAEYAAELRERGRQLAVMADFKHRLDAVLRLCEGRRGDDLLLVSAVAVAAGCGSTALDGLPMTLAWNRSAQVPDAHTTRRQVIVECTSSYGGRADLILVGEERQALAGLLDTEVRDIHAKCPTDGCGTVDDYDVSDPTLFGWSRLQIAGLGEEARWYCCDRCVFDALARAGHELAEADRQAEMGGDL